MSTIRVNFLSEFHFGDDAVLLTLDGIGVAEFSAALTHAERRGASRLVHAGVTQEFCVEQGAAAVELSPTHVIWRFDRAKVNELIDGLAVLSDAVGDSHPTGGHFYVDLLRPADTLVVSRDEYVDVVYPWQSPR